MKTVTICTITQRKVKFHNFVGLWKSSKCNMEHYDLIIKCSQIEEKTEIHGKCNVISNEAVLLHIFVIFNQINP